MIKIPEGQSGTRAAGLSIAVGVRLGKRGHHVECLAKWLHAQLACVLLPGRESARR
jgi:hypothetical protein